MGGMAMGWKKRTSVQQYARNGPGFVRDAFVDVPGPGELGLAPAVTLGVELRSKSRAVTWVRGLDDFGELEAMDLMQEVRRRLRMGVRYHDGRLEVRGDQRRRVRDWFESEGYRVLLAP